MTKKLFKNDFKKMSKVLIYIYLVALALSGITRLINIGKDIQFVAIIGHVFAALTYSALCSILVNTFVQILLVFWNSFYKDQSYLTHTLPVKKSQLLLSKYLSSLLIIISSILVCLVSLFMNGANNIITNMFPLHVGKKYTSGMIAGLLNGACYVGSTLSQYLIAVIAIAGDWGAVINVFFYLCIGITAFSVVMLFIRILCSKKTK